MAIASLDEIAGLEAWYDAADASTITESGGTVSAWDDKSGSGRDLVQAAAANQPIISSANSKPSLLFDAANSQRLSLTGIVGVSPVPQTIVIAMTPTTTAVNDDLLSFLQAGATRFTFRQIGAGLNLRAFWNGTAADDITINSTGVLTTNGTSWHIARMQNADDGSADLLSSDGTESTDPSNNVILTNMDEISVGARTNGANAWSGHIHEIGIWDRVLSNSERADVGNYLNAKWSGLPFEEGSALPVTAVKRFALGIASETSTALGLQTDVGTPIGLATDTGLPLPVTALKRSPIGQASELDTLLPIQAVKRVSLGLPETSSEALPIGPIKHADLGLPSEADQALPIDIANAAQVGIAVEIDQALSVTTVRLIDFGIAVEVDVALGLGLVPSDPTAIALGQKADVIDLKGQAASSPVLISGSKG